jgi:propionate CoA-transferase
VNVSKFNGRTMGPGGFINVTRGAKRLVFAGSFTAGGLKIAIEGGKLVIAKEGKNRKFVESVEQVTFSGTYAERGKQPVLYITERAVFTLEGGAVVLTETAPGVDLERDILAQMNFRPRISTHLKTMDAAIFRPQWGGLRQCIMGNSKVKAARA